MLNISLCHNKTEH